MMKKFAFTLAEVLITLGIIGIVAAITIPNLITNYQKKQTATRLKKVYADLINAVRLSEIDNGSMDGWNFVEKGCSSCQELYEFLETYYLPYYKGAKIFKKRSDISYNPPDGVLSSMGLVLMDGTILAFHSDVPAGYIWIYADINGVEGPNIVGRDIFVFDGYNYGAATKNSTEAYRIKLWGWRHNLKEATTGNLYYGCNKESPYMFKNYFCGRVIELNNWQIPKDYPW
jgi:prepilin-type N-terminal cleavage/methylation domain-containing protein